MRDVQQLIGDALGPAAEPFDYTCSGVTRTGYRAYFPEEPGTGRRNAAAALVERHWRTLHAADVRLFVGASLFRLPTGEYVDGIEVDPDNPWAPLPPASPVVYALPGLPVLDVVEFARTGSHNAPTDQLPFDVDRAIQHLQDRLGTDAPAGLRHLREHEAEVRASLELRTGPEPWRDVRRSLAEVMAIAPFAIQFADKAGLGATFLRPVSDDEAARVAAIIIHIDSDVLDVAPELMTRHGLPVPMHPSEPDLPDEEAAYRTYIAQVGQFQMWWD